VQIKTNFKTLRAAEVNNYTLLNLKHFSISFVHKFGHDVKFSKLMTKFGSFQLPSECNVIRNLNSIRLLCKLTECATRCCYVPSCSNASVRNTGLSIILLTFGTEGAQQAVTHNGTFTGSRLDQQVGSSFFFLTTSRAIYFHTSHFKTEFGKGFLLYS
jgi:hypothetical protein